MADIGLSAFSLFFMQSESFLSHQRRLEQGHGTSNCQTLFGMEKIPTDNPIRTPLDAVSPEALQPCFDQILEQLRQRNGLKAFQRLGGRTLVALGLVRRYIEKISGLSRARGSRLIARYMATRRVQVTA